MPLISSGATRLTEFVLCYYYTHSNFQGVVSTPKMELLIQWSYCNSKERSKVDSSWEMNSILKENNEE